MTKAKIIGILVGLLIAAGLVFLLYYVSGLQPREEEPPDNDLTPDYTDENALLYKGDPAQIDYIQIDNTYGSYRVRKNQAGEVEILGKETVPLFPYSSAALYSSIVQVKGMALIEKDAQTLSDYGLQTPAATVSSVGKDQKTVRFFLGDQAPLADGYYLRMEDSHDVYLVSNTFAERYLADETHLYSNVLTKQIESASLTAFCLNRSGEEIRIRKTEGEETTAIEYATGFVMESPVFCGADNTILESVCESLKSLKASGFAPDLGDTDEARAKYGLDQGIRVVLTAAADTESPQLSSGEKNPYYGFSNADGSPYLITSTYLLGKVEDGLRYVMYDDSPVIYRVEASAFDFAGTDLYQFCQRLVNLQVLSNLSALTLSYDGTDVSFRIAHTEDGGIAVTHDYAPIDADAFRNFYVDLVSLTHTGLGERPDAAPALTVRYTALDGKEDLLELIPYPDNPRKVFISLNGNGVFVTAATQAEQIKDSLKSLLSSAQ